MLSYTLSAFTAYVLSSYLFHNLSLETILNTFFYYFCFIRNTRLQFQSEMKEYIIMLIAIIRSFFIPCNLAVRACNWNRISLQLIFPFTSQIISSIFVFIFYVFPYTIRYLVSYVWFTVLLTRNGRRKHLKPKRNIKLHKFVLMKVNGMFCHQKALYFFISDVLNSLFYF